MKPLLTCILIFTMALALSSPANAASASDASRKGKLVHVVAFKFKPGATQAEIDQLVAAFAQLPRQIKQIRSFEWGTNVSPEQHDKGFTHCFVLGFRTAKDRDAYLVHQDHKEFGKQVGPVVADVFVIDYWAQK